jgi:hypothetical protein
MESERIRKWRYEYLIVLKSIERKKDRCFFLDETWYDTHDVAKKGWMDNSRKCVVDVPSSKGQRIIILNAGSEDGWVHEESLFLATKNMKYAKVDYNNIIHVSCIM